MYIHINFSISTIRYSISRLRFSCIIWIEIALSLHVGRAPRLPLCYWRYSRYNSPNRKNFFFQVPLCSYSKYYGSSIHQGSVLDARLGARGRPRPVASRVQGAPQKPYPFSAGVAMKVCRIVLPVGNHECLACMLRQRPRHGKPTVQQQQTSSSLQHNRTTA